MVERTETAVVGYWAGLMVACLVGVLADLRVEKLVARMASN